MEEGDRSFSFVESAQMLSYFSVLSTWDPD